MNSSERRLAIIDILAERRKEKILNLAHEFNVNRTTIYRDVLELSLSYPIDTKRGNGGCVYVLEGFNLHRRYLNPSEKAVLVKISLTLDENSKKIVEGIIKSFSKRTK